MVIWYGSNLCWMMFFSEACKLTDAWVIGDLLHKLCCLLLLGLLVICYINSV
jgi:hypothetical protein